MADNIDIVERGNIYFLYRPKVQHQDAGGLDDIERFFMVLRPNGEHRFRLMVIGRKKLPDLDDHERNWGFVDRIFASAREIEAELEETHYRTKTRGERVRPATRPAGEGVYVMAQDGRSLKLAYALELPRQPGPVQQALNIAPEGSFSVSIKNPERGSSPNAGRDADEQADYPEQLQQEFGNRRFATWDPRLLDYEGAEFILIGARENVKQDLGIDLKPEPKTEKSVDILKELRLARSRHPVEPLLKGEWR
jgi:hypothetical protein